MTPLRARRPLLVAAVISLTCAPLAAAPARPAVDEATDAVRRANETVATLLKRKVAPGSTAEKATVTEVTRKVRSFLDIDELGRRALVDHWASIAPDQQREYLDLLRTLVERSYVKGLRSNLKYKITYKGSSPSGKGVRVETVIHTVRRGRPLEISVAYDVRREDQAWRAYDIITDEVGLVENYRAQFNKIIGKHGLEGLLERMRKKRDQAP